MKILVTGGAGFIGSHIVDAYIAAGHAVVIIDDLSTGSKANINPGATFYKADITDAKTIAEIFAKEKPEVVNHHAARVSVTEAARNPLPTYETNVVGTVNLLNQPGIRRFIFASTGGAMYADPTQFPASEHAPASPISPYGISKLLAEDAVARYGASGGMQYVILRYSNIFGPRQNAHGESGVVAIFCDLARSGGTPTIYEKETTRDYTYVGDVAAANVAALSRGAGIYNIATGIETTNQQVFETVRDAFNWNTVPRYEPLRPGELARSVLDASKARRDLGWQPTVAFEAGVKAIAKSLHHEP